MSPSTFDHLCPTTTDYPDGVYRVVGTDRTTVTMLRITDGDGNRRHTGDVITIDRTDLDGFASVTEPTTTRSIGAIARSAPTTMYWSIRAFGREVRAHPLAAIPALVLLIVGLVDPLNTALPDRLDGLLMIVGSLSLAYIGSGRLSVPSG
ncbi:MAG: hypothetical protein ABEJ48_04075 [Halobacteriales archaeon]